jgi:hypothetical protein
VVQLYPRVPATHFDRILQPLWAMVGLFVSKRFSAQRECTACTRTNYRIVPLTNLRKYLHLDTSETEVCIYIYIYIYVCVQIAVVYNCEQKLLGLPVS